MVEQTIWLWFGWDCFIAHRGFIIIERTDSWKRQLTAGRDSSVIRTALKTCTKLVVINYFIYENKRQLSACVDLPAPN